MNRNREKAMFAKVNGRNKAMITRNQEDITFVKKFFKTHNPHCQDCDDPSCNCSHKNPALRQMIKKEKREQEREDELYRPVIKRIPEMDDKF